MDYFEKSIQNYNNLLHNRHVKNKIKNYYLILALVKVTVLNKTRKIIIPFKGKQIKILLN